MIWTASPPMGNLAAMSKSKKSRTTEAEILKGKAWLATFAAAKGYDVSGVSVRGYSSGDGVSFGPIKYQDLADQLADFLRVRGVTAKVVSNVSSKGKWGVGTASPLPDPDKPDKDSDKPHWSDEPRPETVRVTDLPAVSLTDMESVTVPETDIDDPELVAMLEAGDERQRAEMESVPSAKLDEFLARAEPTDKWTDDELIEYVRDGQKILETIAKKSAVGYRRCGVALIFLKERKAFGEWQKFLASQGINFTKAKRCIRIAKHFKTEKSILGLTISQAYVAVGIYTEGKSDLEWLISRIGEIHKTLYYWERQLDAWKGKLKSVNLDDFPKDEVLDLYRAWLGAADHLQDFWTTLRITATQQPFFFKRFARLKEYVEAEHSWVHIRAWEDETGKRHEQGEYDVPEWLDSPPDNKVNGDW